MLRGTHPPPHTGRNVDFRRPKPSKMKLVKTWFKCHGIVPYDTQTQLLSIFLLHFDISFEKPAFNKIV